MYLLSIFLYVDVRSVIVLYFTVIKCILNVFFLFTIFTRSIQQTDLSKCVDPDQLSCNAMHPTGFRHIGRQ